MCDVPWFRASSQLLTVTVLIVTRGCEAIVYVQSQCGHTVTSHGDVIISQTSLYYQLRRECSLTLVAPESGQKIKLQFTDLDIISDSSCKQNFLEVRGAAKTHATLGGLGHIFCGRVPPGDVTSLGAWLELKFKSGGAQRGRGFRIVFTAIYQGTSCTQPGMFRCANGACIAARLRCDSVDHCGDGSDEVQTAYDTCTDDEDATIDHLDLARAVFSILGLLITSLLLSVILWQSCAFTWQKCRQSRPFQREEASLMEHRHDDSMVEVDTQTVDTDICNNELFLANNKGSTAEAYSREEEPRIEEHNIEKTTTCNMTTGRFSVQKVSPDENTVQLDVQQKATDGSKTNVDIEVGETDDGKAKNDCRRVSIGRFSVQKIQNYTANEDGTLPIPVASYVISDPTKSIRRPKVSFVLNAGDSNLERRMSKVKFVLHTEDDKSLPSTPPASAHASLKKRGSILKKDPKYPDLQSYTSKLSLSLKSEASSSDEEFSSVSTE